MNNTGSTNLANSKQHSHLNSLGVTSNILMPRIYSQDNTPSSYQQINYPHNTDYISQPMTQQRDSVGESLGSSNNFAVINIKLEHTARYAELCERRILDY